MVLLLDEKGRCCESKNGPVFYHSAMQLTKLTQIEERIQHSYLQLIRNRGKPTIACIISLFFFSVSLSMVDFKGLVLS